MLTPPLPPDRPMGFTPWPVRCPDCNRRQQMTPQMTYGTIVRCPDCNETLFVILLSQLRIAFVALVTREEWVAFSGVPPRDVLRRLLSVRKVA